MFYHHHKVTLRHMLSYGVSSVEVHISNLRSICPVKLLQPPPFFSNEPLEPHLHFNVIKCYN